MSIVEINNLVKKYGDNVAVNDLSLNIDSKGVYGFLWIKWCRKNNIY